MKKVSSVYRPPWQLKDLPVLIVGLGRSGIAAARLCVREEARVKVTDSRSFEEIDQLMLAGLPIETRIGEHVRDDFLEAELIVVSPGVPLDNPHIKAAIQANKTVIGEVELAAGFLTKIPTIAITGTNGKSTTTSLVGAMLGAEGLHPFTGGNLGRALSEAVLERTPPGAIALEVSSFQLETCINFRPNISVLLNISPDHLDRHGSFESYASAKAKIFRLQKKTDSAVFWGDDPNLVELVKPFPARQYIFVNGDTPEVGAGYRSSPARKKATISIRLNPGDAVEEYQIGSFALRGPHNMANAAAAALSCRIAGVSSSSVQHALDGFPGLSHRLERIRVLDGVEWINDSKATNPQSAQVALQSFDGNIIWIAGGRGKGSDYRDLVETARGRVKLLLSIGEEGPVISRLAKDEVDFVEECGSLKMAVEMARDRALSGDVVLLSPACASFDQFDDYEHRGAVFRGLVEDLR